MSSLYRKIKLSLLLLLFIYSNAVMAQVYNTKEGHVEFDSSVPLHSFTGTSDQLVGQINLDEASVDFYVDVHTIKTGIGKRDRDMLRTLDAEENPFVEFFGELVSDFDESSEAPQEVVVEGDFTVHGVTQPVTIEGTLQKNGDDLIVEASWMVNMKDYEIEPPGILFYRVSEQIDVRMNATLNAN